MIPRTKPKHQHRGNRVTQGKTVLVTGAGGFIGRAVGKLLQRAGYGVVGVDVSGHEGEQIDITDQERLQGIFQSRAIAGIVHLAAVLPTAAQRDPVRATEVNVLGSLNVLEMAREFGVRRVVFGSSLSVYGTCAAEHLVSEADRAAPEDLYGAAKVYVEQMGAAYRERYGMEFVSLRIGRVVGPGARSSTSAWRSQIFEWLSTTTPSEIELPYAALERILVVHVEDVAKMLLLLLQAAELKHSLYNACCESVIVGDLKRQVEGLNSNLRIKLGGAVVVGNPRLLDCSRFAGEFGFERRPIMEWLKGSLEGHPRDSRQDAGATF